MGDNNAGAPQKRDWAALLGPTLLAVVISLSIQAGSAIWFFSGVATRLSTVEQKQKADESDAVTEKDIKDRDAAAYIYRQELDTRLNRMDDKLDEILENQPRKLGGK